MKKRWITILTLILTVFLFCGMIPLNTRAEEEAPAETPTVEVSEETEETLPEEPVSVEEETETEEETPTEETAVDESVFEEAVEEIAPVDVPAAAELTAEESLLLEGVRDSEELTAKVLNATRDFPQGVSVSVSSSKVKVVLNQVGTSGTVQLYRMAANEYYEGDTYSGMSESTGVKGTYLGSYLCDRLNEVEFNRYRNDGTDNLYCKYYLIQNGKIYGGPYYAGTIDSMRSVPPFTPRSKKGVIHEDNTTYDLADEMGTSNTVVNMDLASLIYRNEDDDGNPIDNSVRSNVIEFESNGEKFYFDAGYIQEIDSTVSAYSKRGINVTFVVIAWGRSEDFSTYPRSLAYVDEVTWTLAFNTSNERGLKYFTACMEFLAERYSRGSSLGTVTKFVIGNEIDYTYDWCLLEPSRYTGTDGKTHYTRVDFDVFMEEYARGLRIADMAVKKYNSDAKVFITFTHNWADARWETYVDEDGLPYIDDTIRVWNSYSPKKCMDWLNTIDKARGDYNWGASFHPYPIGTSSNIPNYTDLHTDEYYSNIHSSHPGLETVKKATGNWRTSPWVTCANLEIYQQYFDQAANRYNGKETREVILTETSICSSNARGEYKPDAVEAIIYHQATNIYQNAVHPEQTFTPAQMKTLLLYRQAGAIAMYYYRAAQIPCITEVAYFQPHDQDAEVTNKLGLMEVDGTKKPSFDVWKYVDTNLSQSISEKYLKHLTMYYENQEDYDSYYDLMDISNSGYWSGISEEAFWQNIMARTVEIPSVTHSIVTDKQTYSADDPIYVTATGTTGDSVALYKKGEKYDEVDPIFSYAINSTVGSTVLRSGRTLDLLAYGTVSLTRQSDATLKTGDYVVVLRQLDGEYKEVNIHISGRYSIGTTTAVLKTNKSIYNVGEDVIVVAGGGENYWAGLYGKDDTPSKITSIYWYYVNDGNRISGKPTVMQTTTHNTDSSNPSPILKAGEYKLILFDTGGYTVAKDSQGKDMIVYFTVEGELEVPSLKSITYELENKTDGFANGKVTITKDPEADQATDCVMYWADASGKPLEGYTSLAMFKLKGKKTVHEMYTHTIIPAGAKKLIAYATNGFALSENYVSVDLPDNCTYSLGTPITEFQIISDVHVTTDAGAVNEVRLSNQHFSQMLEDVKAYSPKSAGIFINGDIANTGVNAEFQKVYDLYWNAVSAGNGNVPDIHMSVGNHDWYKGNPNKQFEKWAYTLNSNLSEVPKIYYDEVVDGYHFVYLGHEASAVPSDQGWNGVYAHLSKEQLQWLDETLAGIQAEGEDKPVFLFLHQSFYNTVSGSLPGQGWNGVANETALKNVLKKYDNIILLNGHSHWELNSLSCMYSGDELIPNGLNTAAVGYLWSSYNIVGGEQIDGSHGYYVRVYDDKVVFLGRDFENNLWIPSAIFVLKQNEISVPKDEYTISTGSEAVNLGVTTSEKTGSYVNYLSLDSSILSVTEDGTLIPKKSGTTEVVITAYGTGTTVISRKTIKVTVEDNGVIRLSGPNRYDTSIATAEELKEVLGVDSFKAIVLTTGRNFADALGGGYLAAKMNAPILITNPNSQKDIDKINDFIRRNLDPDGTLYILGGEGAVPQSCLKGLEDYKNVIRLAGKDRYKTNLLILEKAGVTDEDILICTGKSFADSLAASATGKALLLVKGDGSLSAEQKAFLAAHSSNRFYIIGGTGAVNETIENEAKAYNSVQRLSGKTRYETSTLIAETFFHKPEKAILAYSHNFPDALGGGPLGYFTGSPIILTQTTKESTAQKYTYAQDIRKGYILGGDRWISSSCAALIFQLNADLD